MALSRTSHVNVSGASSGSLTTSSFTPSDNSLLVVGVGFNGPSGDPSATIALSGGGLTWTRQIYKWQTNTDFPPGGSGVAIYTAPVSTGASMTVTLTQSGTTSFFISVIEYTGYNTASPVGGTASNSRFGGVGAMTATLSSTPATTSEVFSVALAESDDSPRSAIITSGTGWTSLWADEWFNFDAFETEVRGSSTSTTVTWDNIDLFTDPENLPGSIAAIEIQAATFADNKFIVSGTATNGNKIQFVNSSGGNIMTGRNG